MTLLGPLGKRDRLFFLLFEKTLIKKKPRFYYALKDKIENQKNPEKRIYFFSGLSLHAFNSYILEDSHFLNRKRKRHFFKNQYLSLFKKRRIPPETDLCLFFTKDLKFLTNLKLTLGYFEDISENIYDAHYYMFPENYNGLFGEITLKEFYSFVQNMVEKIQLKDLNPLLKKQKIFRENILLENLKMFNIEYKKTLKRTFQSLDSVNSYEYPKKFKEFFSFEQ